MSEPHLRGSIAEVEDERSGKALVRPASKVHQLHTKAATEPHHICRPQVAMHNVPLVQPTQCLAHLYVASHTGFKHAAFLNSLTSLEANNKVQAGVRCRPHDSAAAW